MMLTLETALLESNVTLATQLLTDASSSTARLAKYNEVLNLGVGFDAAAHSSSLESTLQSSDGCVGSLDEAACRSVYQGVMTKGLQPAFEQFVSLAQEVIADHAHRLTNGTGVTLGSGIAADNWQQLRELAVHMQHGFRTISAQRLSLLSSLESSFVTVAGYSMVCGGRVRVCGRCCATVYGLVALPWCHCRPVFLRRLYHVCVCRVCSRWRVWCGCWLGTFR